LELIAQHEGNSKKAIINAAKGRFTRQRLRAVIDRVIMGRQIRIEKKLVYIGKPLVTQLR